ncbi:uncharacterized protein B0T15DRAFT_189101 [Chaetomium strumarium]|uniref:C2H2-type domain-containing protein n=1 Tax=Chaetomium strumarium TaxID=1170767 RepID=A0AAJ0GS46_9PEZI|nr:hypothetical protein B0T15DRAFT_189101 [Chaetomium strumarium]
MHWQIGNIEMTRRAGLVPFSLDISSNKLQDLEPISPNHGYAHSQSQGGSAARPLQPATNPHSAVNPAAYTDQAARETQVAPSTRLYLTNHPTTATNPTLAAPQPTPSPSAAVQAEKPHECSFCAHCFKNKREARRHRNSAHIQQHSWSCSVLTGYGQAFYDSTARPGTADVCGYCGKEFLRSVENQGVANASEQGWKERIGHPQELRKFGRCNLSKKFYRADSFRMH